MRLFLAAIFRAEIAKALTNFKYAFVFGCNMFLALVIESVFTAVVVDQSGFGVDIRTQVSSLKDACRR